MEKKIEIELTADELARQPRVGHLRNAIAECTRLLETDYDGQRANPYVVGEVVWIDEECKESTLDRGMSSQSARPAGALLRRHNRLPGEDRQGRTMPYRRSWPSFHGSGHANSASRRVLPMVTRTRNNSALIRYSTLRDTPLSWV